MTIKYGVPTVGRYNLSVFTDSTRKTKTVHKTPL